MAAGQRRPAHKLAHAQCPYGQSNWSDCDVAATHRFGPCRAMVGDREPTPCSRWAMDADGWCSQHFSSQHDAEVRKARAEAEQLQLEARIDAFIAKAASPDFKWWESLTPSAVSTRGLPGVAEVEGRVLPRSTVPGRAGGDAPRPRPHRITQRNRPHRLTELA